MLRSILMFIIFFLSSVLIVTIMDQTKTMQSEALFSPLLRAIAKSAILFFWFFSFTRTFMIHDPVYLSRYRFVENEKMTAGWISVVGNMDFWMEGILFEAALLVVPRFGPFGFLIGFLEDTSDPLPFSLIAGFLTITVLPVFLLLLFLAHLSARKYISGFDNPYLAILESERGTRKRNLFLEITKMSAIYFIGALIFPLVLPIIMTLVRMLGWIALAIFLILALFLIVFRYFRALLKRRSFRKRLLKMCKEKRIVLKLRRGFFRSVFSMSTTYDFSVFVGEERYDCKMISSPRKYSPVFFDENGTLIRTTTVRFMRDVVLFHSVTVRDFRFLSDGKKILILNPTPQKIFLKDRQGKALADTGERIGEYVLFTGSGFLHALDRNCMELFFDQS